MRTLRAVRHITQLDRAHVIKLWRMAPDIQKLGLPYVACGEGKLHAGVNVAIGRDVARGVTFAARQAVEVIFGDFGGRRAEFFHVPNQALVAKHFCEFGVAEPQCQQRAVPVHLRRNSGVHGHPDTKIITQCFHTGIIPDVLKHEGIGDCDVQAVKRQRRRLAQSDRKEA